MRFEQLRPGRDGGLSAWLEVTVELPTVGPVLHDKTFNLASSTAQMAWAKHLATRTDGAMPIDWPGVLEQACRLVRKAHVLGGASQLIRETPRPAVADWLLRPLVLGRMPTILFGAGGSGKSALALAAAIDIQRGTSDMLGLAIAAPRNVLWLDCEFDSWEHKKRLAAMVGGDVETGEGMPDIRYAWSDGVSLEDQVFRLEKMIEEYSIEFLVIDSVNGMLGGEPEAAERAIAFFNAIDRLQIGALCIAHETKESDHKMPFGSSVFHNRARVTWYVNGQQDEGSDELNIGLFNRKSNTARRERPIGYNMTFQNDEKGDPLQITISRQDVRDVEGQAELVVYSARIEYALRDGAMSTDQLSEVLSIKQTVVKNTLNRMARRNIVVPLDTMIRGKARLWGLAARDPSAASTRRVEQPESLVRLPHREPEELPF